MRPCLIVVSSSHARGVDSSIFYRKGNHNSDVSENREHAYEVSIFYYKTKIRHHNSEHCDIVTFVVLM